MNKVIYIDIEEASKVKVIDEHVSRSSKIS